MVSPDEASSRGYSVGYEKEDGRDRGGRGRWRATLVVLVALVLVLLFALGCTSDQRASEQRASEQRASNQRTSVEAPSEKVVVAAGDIAACHSGDDEVTARLLSNIRGTVLTLGDNAYEDGTPEEFAECYDSSWGRYKARTKPTPGNHEYHTQGAEGYFDYFADAAGDPDEGYYSYDLGAWHMVALNSNCQEVGGCGDASPQVRWLEEDPAANDEKACTLV